MLRDELLHFSNTLCGQHHNLMAHIRNQHDTVLFSVKQLPPCADDPQQFRDLMTLVWDSIGVYGILDNPQYSLLNDEDSFHCHWFTCRTIALYREWCERTDQILRDRSHNRFGCVIPFEGSVFDYELQLVDSSGEPVHVTSRIRLYPDRFDWRNCEMSPVHGVVNGKWRRTPERLALAILRLVS